MNGIILIVLFLALTGLAYTFVVLFPLLGMILGLAKVHAKEQKKWEHVKEDLLNYEEGLGFTMADGGEQRDLR
jgi:hypothetical protein